MPLLAVVVLAVIQGLAELLPVSSSAHVIVAEKLLGLDPTAPEMTLLLVMLHSGTMLAVIVYFWSAWRRTFFASAAVFRRMALLLAVSTALTAAVGYPIKWLIERIALRRIPGADVEMIFGNLAIMSAALAAAGALILYAGLRRRGGGPGAPALPQAQTGRTREAAGGEPVQAPAGARTEGELDLRTASWMGAVQGLCLPFRGFSRSGATISAGLLAGGGRAWIEEYSFALAVILTPPVVLREVRRLLAARGSMAAAGGTWHLFGPSLLGMGLSFLAGVVALAWLSRWLERGAWHWFGAYCLVASAVVLVLHLSGF